VEGKMEYLRIGKRQIEYELRKSSKAKRLIVTIKHQKLKVSVPAEITFTQARRYLENNKDLILKHIEKQNSAAGETAAKEYVSGEKLLYRGRHYPLLIEEKAGPGSSSASFIGSRIVVIVPPGLSKEKKSQSTKKILEEWYIRQAQKLLPEQVEYYARQLDITYQKLRIKDQKTKWGSCSSKGYINLNWRIIMAPNQVAAYVIIHELAHLKYMNHSKEFWAFVEQILPDYKKWKSWLKKHCNELMDG
jgi:Predicted metal-dependent hydrolase